MILIMNMIPEGVLIQIQILDQSLLLGAFAPKIRTLLLIII